MTDSPSTLRLHNLLHSGTKSFFQKGEIVQSSDGHLCLALIEKGFLKRYLIKNDGSLGVQSLYGPDSFFPLTLAFELLYSQSNHLYSGPETFYYEAMTDTEIYTIDNDVFVKAINEDPLLYRGLLAESGKRLHFYIQKLENITLPNSYKRVAHQILFYAKEFGDHEGETNITIMIPLTHQTIGDTLSLTRETVSQSVSKLRRQGLINVKNSHGITVPDLAKLQNEAYS